MESISFEFEKMNEVEETAFTAQDIDVVISYYWDSHGRPIEWKGPNGEFREEIHADSVRIVDKEWDMKMFENIYHHTSSVAYINGNEIQALTVEYQMKREILYIDAYVGAG